MVGEGLRFDSVTGLRKVFTFDLRLSSRLGLTFFVGGWRVLGWRLFRTGFVIDVAGRGSRLCSSCLVG
jgi:hypothetical protein